MTFPVTLLPELALAFMLIFARMGAIVMLMPGFGEQTVTVRIRLVIALAITYVLFPLVSSRFGPVPQGFGGLVVLIVREILIGIAVGLAMRLVLAAVQTAGMIIANQVGLAFAMNFDPTQGGQGALLGNFMSMTVVTLIFVTDLHHLAIAGLADSYRLFAPGAALPMGDFSRMAVETIAESFVIAMQISAPFLVFGILFQFGLGILSRLMPQIQIFFMATPANIYLGLLFFALLIGSIMTWYLGHVQTVFGRFLAP